MRTGGCRVQQPLTPEAAAVVKQAVGLAHRRGHAQVTPLHVASTMLSSSGGLLRSACLQSHSHPFQCKALELCFNVALNRLPASASSSSSPLLGGPHYHPPPQHQHPSLSNALVAAFKRAQAHQRRGSVESQQQPLLTVKIELGQLIVSTLDDPSVSRVMLEAGFSSTQVKANVLQAVSVESTVAPAANPSPSKPKEVIRAIRPCLSTGRDVTSVVDCISSGTRRSVAVVGDSLASAAGVVKGVIDLVEKGDVPEDLKNLRFITLPLFSFWNSEREEVEQKVGEMRRHIGSCCAGTGGAVLYLGDLSWAAEYRAKERGNNYCPVEHVIMEIKGLLVCGGSVRFWVMGISTYETYVKCRVGNPSLEALLGLHALAFPSAGLELSLNCDSDSSSMFKSKRSGDGPHWPLLEDGIEINQLTCCGDCSIKFETEARGLRNASSSSHGFVITSTLPSWLQQYKEENNNDQDSLQHLYKKWNSICDSAHRHGHPSSEITLRLSSISPSSSSVSSYDYQPFGHTARFSLQENPHPNPNPNPNPHSTSSSDTMETECLPRFKEINSENLKILCNALEKKVPRQKTIIPEIASAVLQCRSGTMRRKEGPKLARAKEGTWLFFQGGDVEGKEKIARELANLVFGTHTNLVSIELSTYSSTRSDSIDDLRNKRSRSTEASRSHLERLFEALRENPHRVFLVEDIQQADSRSQMGIKAAIESGRVRGSGGEEVDVGDAIIILSCESFDWKSRACSPPVGQRMDDAEVKDGVSDDKEISSSVCLDLNLCAVEDDDDFSFGDMGIVDSVDRAFFFNLPDD